MEFFFLNSRFRVELSLSVGIFRDVAALIEMAPFVATCF
jgi:hypothetical protein